MESTRAADRGGPGQATSDERWVDARPLEYGESIQRTRWLFHFMTRHEPAIDGVGSTQPAPIGLLGPGRPWRGGITHYNARLGAALRHAGHPVRAVGYRRTILPRPFTPGHTAIDLSATPLGLSAPQILDPFWPPTWPRAVRHFVHARVHGVLIHWWDRTHGPCLRAVARGLRRAGIRPVFLVHNAEPATGSLKGHPLTRLAFSQAAALFAPSRSTLRGLRRQFPDQLIVLTPHPPFCPRTFGPPPPDRTVARRLLGIAADAEIPLFFGAPRRAKGLDLLLDALEFVKRPRLRLFVAGQLAGGARSLRGRLAAPAMRGRVTVLDGYVPNEEVGTVFAAADVVVLPYREGSRSGVQALATGFRRPVIVTRVGGLPEYVEPGTTGRVVPAEDPPALAGALAEFFQREEGRRMESVLSKRAQSTTWDGLAARVVTVATGKIPDSGCPGGKGETMRDRRWSSESSEADDGRSQETGIVPDDERNVDVRA
jgi:glycosyltransferase involved in cell wall biosynthesis